MDDESLVRAARAGDAAGWAGIYDRYADRLHDHCWSILRDPNEASDALHDTFIAAARALPQLRDPTRLRPWLYAIARNEALRRCRARKRVTPVEAVDEMSAPLDVDLDADAHRDELRTLVWDAAAGLAPRDQAMLDLHLRQGLEGADLAQALGVSDSHARVLLTRLRDQVERSLGALLVARTGRRKCDELRAILGDWDGRLSPLLRKRVARHIDDCDECGRRRRVLVSPMALLAAVPIVAAPSAMRDRVLGDVERVSAVRPIRGRRLAAGIGAAAAVAVIAAAGTVLAARGGDGATSVQAAAGPGSTTTIDEATTTTATTADITTTTAPPTTLIAPTVTTVTTAPPATLPPGALAIDTGWLDLGAEATSGTVVFRNTGGRTLSWSASSTHSALTIAPASGSIAGGQVTQLSVSFAREAVAEGPFAASVSIDAGSAGGGTVGVHADVNRNPEVTASANRTVMHYSSAPGCPTNTASVTATVTDESPLSSVTLQWVQGSTVHDVPMTGGGTTWAGRIGPLTVPGNVTWTVTAVDPLGNTTTTAPRTIEVLPPPC